MRKVTIWFILFVWTSTVFAQKRILMENLGVSQDKDITPIVLEALQQADFKDAILVFPKGTYHFYPDYAVEKLLYISNHDEDTIKRIAFDLTGFQHLVIRGEETQFLFHTDVIPFYLHACEDITIEGVKIDYVRPGYSEGKIRELEPQRMVVEIDPTEYPYEILMEDYIFAAKIFSMK